MSEESAAPAGWLDRVQKLIDERVSAAIAGLLRSATISSGGLTVSGGFLRLLFGAFNLFYVGPVGPVLSNGTRQQVVRIRRADGTIALQTNDAFPGADGTLNQALSWLDRAGNAVFADDTDSGQGIGRPYLPFVLYRARNVDWPTLTSGSFVTVYRAKGVKQHPRLYVETFVNAPDAGAIAEVQVLVNGTVWGAAKASTAGFVTGINFGPLPVAGAHIAELSIEVQYRLASGTGVVQCGPARVEGRQT